MPNLDARPRARGLSAAVVLALVVSFIAVPNGGPRRSLDVVLSSPVTDGHLLPLPQPLVSVASPGAGAARAVELVGPGESIRTSAAQLQQALLESGTSIYDGGEYPRLVAASTPVSASMYAQVGQVLLYAYADAIGATIPLSTLLAAAATPASNAEPSKDENGLLRAYWAAVVDPARASTSTDWVRLGLLALPDEDGGTLTTALATGGDVQLRPVQALILLVVTRADALNELWNTTPQPTTLSVGHTAPVSVAPIAWVVPARASTCNIDGVPASFFKGLATVMGQRIAEMEDLIGIPKNSQGRVGKVLGIINVMATIMNALATWIMFSADVAATPVPVVRTQSTVVPGREAVLEAHLRLDGGLLGRSDFINCLLRSLSSIGVDAGAPRDSALAGVAVEWRVWGGPAFIESGDQMTGPSGRASAKLVAEVQPGPLPDDAVQYERSVDVGLVAHPMRPGSLGAWADLALGVAINQLGDVFGGQMGAGTVDNVVTAVVLAIDQAGAWNVHKLVPMVDWGTYAVVVVQHSHEEGNHRGDRLCSDSQHVCGYETSIVLQDYVVVSIVALQGGEGLWSGVGTSEYTSFEGRNDSETVIEGDVVCADHTIVNTQPATVEANVLAAGIELGPTGAPSRALVELDIGPVAETYQSVWDCGAQRIFTTSFARFAEKRALALGLPSPYGGSRVASYELESAASTGQFPYSLVNQRLGRDVRSILLTRHRQTVVESYYPDAIATYDEDAYLVAIGNIPDRCNVRQDQC